MCHNGGWILVTACQESHNEKKSKAADVEDDVMSKHNVILLLALTNDFVSR